MKTEIFDFDLPEALIARFPLQNREAARLLVDGKKDFHIYDLPDLIDDNTLIVINDTKVIPARLYGLRGDQEFEITLFEKVGVSIWEAMIKGSKRLKVGDVFQFFKETTDHTDHADHTEKKSAALMTAELIDKKENGRIVLQFDVPDADFFSILDTIGTMPLPPYLKRRATQADNDTYQTVFAKEKGAVAAPTAGLHFTEALMAKIKAKGAELVSVTLHVGAGTFLPIKSADIRDHHMHFEYGIVSAHAANRINAAKHAGKTILCIGTTALRLVESASDDNGIRPFSGRTNLFIMPGYRFKTVDALLTNFHLPKSTLFILICAFSGIKEMQNAYKYAIKQKYRFFSYGDAMLLHRKEEEKADAHP